VPVDLMSAAVAGVVAAQVMEMPAYVQRARGRPLRQDVFTEGGVLLRAPAPRRRIVGYLGHIALAVLISLFYAAFFLAVGDDHLLAWGALGGLVHFAVGGLVVGAVFPMTDSEVGMRGLRSPGFAYRCYGRRDVTTFFAGHITFGCLLGLLYPVLHPVLSVGAVL
jgi:hypothetical protein